MNKKVILIWPAEISRQSALYPPLGLSYISTFLEKNDIKTEIIDMTFQDKKNIPDSEIYGISVSTPLYERAKKISEFIKNISPDSSLILGGPHPTVAPEKTLKDIPWADVI